MKLMRQRTTATTVRVVLFEERVTARITPMMTESMITTASNFTFDDLFDAIVVYVGLIRFCLCKLKHYPGIEQQYLRRFSAPDGGMRALRDRTLKGTRDGDRWRLCRRGCTPRYRGVAWRLCLYEDAVRTVKTLPERYDPAPDRVAPDAGGRKRRCDAFV